MADPFEPSIKAISRSRDEARQAQDFLNSTGFAWHVGAQSMAVPSSHAELVAALSRRMTDRKVRTVAMIALEHCGETRLYGADLQRPRLWTEGQGTTRARAKAQNKEVRRNHRRQKKTLRSARRIYGLSFTVDVALGDRETHGVFIDAAGGAWNLGSGNPFKYRDDFLRACAEVLA